MPNAGRLDLWPQPTPNEAQSTTALPTRDAARFRWNANPYEMDNHGDGTAEGDPAAWLLAYWLARYHGLLGGDEAA